jgi:putative redox protein
MNVTVHWKGNMTFEAIPPSGDGFTMDAYPDSGGNHNGPTPIEALLSSVAACTAMDVIAILRKKRQKVTDYRIEVEATRTAGEGEYPRPITSIVVRHILEGEALDHASVERAIELSDTKYCSVVATLRILPEVKILWEVVED